MDWLEFVASLVGSLAWPAAVVALLLLFRKQVGRLMTEGLHKVKAGPFEAEWDRAERRTAAELGVTVSADVDPSDAAAARLSPRGTILERFFVIEQALREAVPAADDGKVFGGRTLINEAAKAGVISVKTAEALVGLAVMRNLAAHGPDDIDAGQAAEFMALADAAQFALDRDLHK